MNIYQRIVLVIGGIGMALVIFTTLEASSRINRVILNTEDITYNDLELLLRNDFILTIAYCLAVASLTFSAYVGLIPLKKKNEDK